MDFFSEVKYHCHVYAIDTASASTELHAASATDVYNDQVAAADD